jgi:hypothetical protein
MLKQLIIRLLQWIGLLSVLLLLSNCDRRGELEQVTQRIPVKYHLQAVAEGKLDSLLSQYDAAQIRTILALNRVDRQSAQKLDSLLIPDTVVSDFLQYSPFPDKLHFLRNVRKIIFFSYPAQAFAVYNSGKLVRWGPTSMGKRAAPTPEGIYYANWKAEETISTVDDEWILKWNVNIENKEGIGWHHYAMPGIPASHSCMRLLEDDALYLYDWVDEWIMEDDETVLVKGTPTVVYGKYNFDGPKPWYSLSQNSKALDIDPDLLNELVAAHLPEILRQQKKRDQHKAADTNVARLFFK